MLNDRECRNAKRQEKPYKLADGNGLYLEVKPNGVKAWRYRFEIREAGAGLRKVCSPSAPMRCHRQLRQQRK